MSVKRKKRGLGDETAAASEPVGQSAGMGAGEAVRGPGSDAGGSEEAGEALTASAAGSDAPAVAQQGGPSGPEGASVGEEGAAADSVRALEAELAETKDLLLRKIADFDNFRKRMARDKEESVRYANAALVVDLIEVMDGLERAIASTESSQDFSALHQGVVLIEKQLVDNLQRKWGLERMKTAGTNFDPALHQAIMVGDPVEGGGQVVLEELQSGYTLHERVVRPAKVKVSAPRPRGVAQPADGPGGAEGGGA